jgi:hypothetical protein
MQQASFWTRVGHWIRPGTSRQALAELPDASPPSLDGDGADPVETEASVRTQPLALRRRPREDVLTRLEDGFNRVVNLCDSLNVHFTLQEERTAQVADSLRRVAGDMSRLATVVENQGETLHAVVGQLQAGNDHNQKVQELFQHVAKLTEAQRQALAVVAQQVDGARQTDERIAESLGTFQKAITILGEACNESTVSLRQLRTQQAAGDEQLARLVDRQGRRFVMLFIVTVLLAISGIAGLLIRFFH